MDQQKWGRMAVGRFQKSAEEIQAEIIKSLEGKLSVEFKDYSQWQRISTQMKPAAPAIITKQTTKKKKKDDRPLTGVSKTSCSTLCLHPWNKISPPKDNTQELQSKDRCILLQFKIDAKEKSCKMYRDLKSKLLAENDTLHKEIEFFVKDSHLAVTQYLEQYEKFNIASKTQKKKHFQEIHGSHLQVRMLSANLEKEIKALKIEVTTLDAQLKFINQDLKVLRSYKDKEYPVKAMQLSKLRAELKRVRNHNQNEDAELDRIISGQRSQLYNGHSNKISSIIKGAADNTYNMMVPASVPNMAWHNTILENDIAIHLRAISQLHQDITLLKQDIEQLKKLPQTNAKRFVFPELHLPTNPCHPDEDVVLQIPTFEMLPI